jgi:hypothetical protein
VSRYCTAGNVARRVNAVSTASFTLRNPDMLFTAKGGSHAPFFPMDPVTIYLQRLKDRPIRVFTGFLDETPYYELYPGTIEFSASCTLKKLLYTYFDPGLPYTMNFLADYGWVPGTDGSIYNPQAINGIESDKDGGMGALLFATMQHIGHWNKQNIKIEALPADLITRMGNMLRTFEEESKEAQKELETLISRFVGAGDYGNSGAPSDGNVDVSGYEGDVPEVIFQVGKAMGADTKLMLSAFMTGIVESGMKNLTYGNADSKGWRQERVSIYGDGPDGATNVNASAKRYFKEGLSIMAGKTPGKASTGMYQESWTAGNLAQAIQGSAVPDAYDAVRAKAVALMEKINGKVNEKDAGTAATVPGVSDTTVRGGKKTKASNTEDATNRSKLGKSVDVHGASEGLQVIVNLAASYGLQITAGKNDHGVYTSTGNVSDHSRGWAVDVSNGSAPTPEMDSFNEFVKTKLKPLIKQLIWRDKDQFNGYVIGGHMNHVHVAIKPEYANSKTNTLNAVVDALAGRPLANLADAATSDSTTTTDNSSTNGILSRANATVLASTMQWASIEEQLESVALQGNKSLMNDKPLLPFIQQMTESSLRQFQSMPNGDFFAFYPDYFGETWHRPPYWLIDDIEVLEGRVKLNDAALVTHEYAIGNTYGPFTSNPLQNKLMSAGVVSITNAFQANLVQTDADQKANGNNADKDTKKLYHAFNRILKQDEAVQFLERYGARPDVQDFPFIRNPFFELFMAYQRFMQAWSRQFLSPFKLTFMPELYPGGKVGFPEHGLQMYIEEVTHSWDYTSGFVTEADLSAPAAMLDDKGNPLNDNLPPNMPTALIEVAAAKTDAPGSPGSGAPGSGVVVADDGNGQQRPT